MASSDLTVVEFIEEVVAGVTPDNGARASNVLTATLNFTAAETVTIGSKVYTFQTSLTNVDGNVKIGTDLEESLENLANAINLSGGVPGTDYALVMSKNTQVSAVSNATTLTVTALVGGTAQNTVATTELTANSSWASVTLLGGTDSTNTEWSQMRFTGESLNFAIQNTVSEEIRPDRTQADLIQTSASGSGDINVELSYGSFDPLLEAALCGDWIDNVLVNGSQRRFFTFRKRFQDMTPQQFHLYRGTCVEGFTFSMELDSIVSGTFTLMSFGIDPDTGIMTQEIEGETSVALSSESPMNAVTNFKNLMLGGVPYSGCISSLTMQVRNNIRAIQCLGSITPRDMRLGTIEITGDVEFHFNDGSVYDKFVKGTEFDIDFLLQDNSGNSLEFEFPRVKLETSEVVAGGRNTDVMISGTYRALYDVSSGHVMRITRSPA